MSVKASELSKGEKLLIQRRREGQTQAQAAEEQGVSLYVYRRWEADTVADAPKVGVGRLDEYEQYFLLRKRSGRTLAETAEELDVCRWWLCQMESGEAPIDRLRDYWATSK